MSNVNPTGILWIAFWAVIGALFGHVLVGLAVGLGPPLVADLRPLDRYDNWQAARRRRRRLYKR